MIPACLPPRDVSRPKVPPPPDACDTHAHVFGPAQRFPYTGDRSYTPPDAPLEKYLGMLDTIGFARGVLVQGSAHGRDNSAMLDALKRWPDRLRGVAVADSDISPADLRAWDRLGIRGLRFNHFFRDGQLHYRGGVPLTAAERLAPLMAELGWHLQLWIDVKDLPETIPVLKLLGLPVVIDHMGRTDARAGTSTEGFQSLLRAVGDGWCWAKLSGAHRISRDAPDYPDARPFHEALVRANPERLVWGGDWPHPRVEGEMPDAGHLFELFQMWTPDQATQHRILVTNPAKTLWIPELKVSSTMSVNNKRVFYVKYLPHEIYVDILRARPDVRLDRLENESADSVSAPILAAAHAYQIGAARDELARHFHVDQDMLRRAPNLLIVSSNGAGYDPVDVEACTAAGVLVVNQSGGNAHSVAEHALGMLLTLSKRILEADRAMRREANVSRNALMGTEAQGKTIGIVGLGNVGRRIAALCNGLLGMKVLAYDPYLTAAEMAARGADKVELDELLRRSDYVSISCPLTRESRGMIGAREFALMQPHAYFITTARGFIHDEPALVEALRNKRIAGAGLDVWSKEPPPPDHPLLQFDNVLASPHTAGVTREARANMGKIAAEQILDALDGKRPSRIINPEVWDDYAKRFERTFGFVPA